MAKIAAICALLMTIACVGGTISNNCLQCICQIEGCQKEVGKCKMDVGSLSCGPFQIKEPYYKDCYSPGSGWQSCTKEMACSETCVRGYMGRYGTYCSRSANPTCEDYARIHNGGPLGCRHPNTEAYWRKVNACCQTKPGGC